MIFLIAYIALFVVYFLIFPFTSRGKICYKRHGKDCPYADAGTTFSYPKDMFIYPLISPIVILYDIIVFLISVYSIVCMKIGKIINKNQPN